jgi:hypothetical protein
MRQNQSITNDNHTMSYVDIVQAVLTSREAHCASEYSCATSLKIRQISVFKFVRVSECTTSISASNQLTTESKYLEDM